MANYTYINGDLSILKTVLENSGYFDTIETGTVDVQSSTTSGLRCGIGGENFFQIGLGTVIYAQVGHGSIWSLVVKGDGVNTSYMGVFTTNADGATMNNYKPVEAYQAANGLIIICNAGRILITKNQNGDTVIVFGNGYQTSSTNTSNDVMKSIVAVASTDTMTPKAASANVETFGQTLPIPICTNSYGVSYTDKAYRLEYKQYTEIGYIKYKGKRYFTDGFYAVEDEEETT